MSKDTEKIAVIHGSIDHFTHLEVMLALSSHDIGGIEQQLKHAVYKEWDWSTWDFVEQFYPNYSSCREIAYNDDLHKICEGEIDHGSQSERILAEDFNGNVESAIIAMKISDGEIYHKAIEGFIDSFINRPSCTTSNIFSKTKNHGNR